jgi:hypothetical protein
MGKMKQLSLEHRGYEIRGVVTLSLWGGDKGTIDMQPVFISDERLSHTTIKRSINDNGFGCMSIDEAVIEIYDVYGNQEPRYKQYNRTIELDNSQCKEAFK